MKKRRRKRRQRSYVATKTKIFLLALYRKSLLAPHIDGLKLKGWKNTYQPNTNQNKAEVAILIADKEYFRTKKMTRYK